MGWDGLSLTRQWETRRNELFFIVRNVLAMPHAPRPPGLHLFSISSLQTRTSNRVYRRRLLQPRPTEYKQTTSSLATQVRTSITSSQRQPQAQPSPRSPAEPPLSGPSLECSVASCIADDLVARIGCCRASGTAAASGRDVWAPSCCPINEIPSRRRDGGSIGT